MKITPSVIAGIRSPSGERTLSPEANDLINRLREHYKAQGKASAAHNYSRHLKSFLIWVEAQGYSIQNLPTDAVESFLSSLTAAGQKETTTYVMRTQLKSALREAGTALGLEVGHIEYQTGKPVEIRRAQKEKEKRQRAEKRLVQTAQTLEAIRAAQQNIMGSVTVTQPIAADPQQLETPDAFPAEIPMSDQSAPQQSGSNPPGGMHQSGATMHQSGAAGQPIVINVPSQGHMRPTTTIGAAQQQRQSVPQPQRGVVLNNFTFNGPYIRVSRMADGSDPLTPPGTEVFVQTLPSSMIAPHGDIASFLQSYLIPKLRLAPAVSQVHFIFNELNDKRQPTGKRDEMVVSVPGAGEMGFGMAQAPAQASSVALGGLPYPAPSGGMDRATEFLLTKLDREAEEAKARAERLQDEMKKASDAQTTFLLMQQFQKEQDLRRQIEDERRHTLDRSAIAAAPPPVPVAMTPPMQFPTILPPEPQSNGTAELAKAFSESQARMMEMMVAAMNRPQPVAPAPPVQKDVSEWLIPFIAQMNQQQQAQAAAQQQMMMQQQNQTVQILQAMLTRENPTEKLLFAQLQEVKAAANAPKADELESFADKLQKMKMVSDMLGGNSGPGFLSELLANADTIGAGAAKVIAAAKTQTPAGLNGVRAPGAQPQLPAGPQAAAPSAMPEPPPETLAHLQQVVEGVDTEDVQKIVNNVIDLIKTLLAQPETTPFPAMGRRMLAAFQNAEDEGELYTLAKNLWKQLGQPYDRPAAKTVAAVLAQWYSVIHQHLFGEPKELASASEDEESEDGDEVVEGEADGPDEDDGVEAAAG